MVRDFSESTKIIRKYTRQRGDAFHAVASLLYLFDYSVGRDLKDARKALVHAAMISGHPVNMIKDREVIASFVVEKKYSMVKWWIIRKLNRHLPDKMTCKSLADLIAEEMMRSS